MLNRRSVVAGLGLSMLGFDLAFGETPAQNVANIEAEMKAWIDDPAHTDYFRQWTETTPGKLAPRGSKILAPSDPRVKEAARLLAQLPTDRPPIAVAKWMIGNIGSLELMEWPPDSPGVRRPANPLIVAFFAATKTNPTAGDETAWCAAFMSYMLRHGGLPYPNSAASASFRSFSKLPATSDPQVGDLIVFRNATSPQLGHVTFFDGFANAGKSVAWCVGGNQGNTLSRKRFALSSTRLVLHSFRTGPGLRAS